MVIKRKPIMYVKKELFKWLWDNEYCHGRPTQSNLSNHAFQSIFGAWDYKATLWMTGTRWTGEQKKRTNLLVKSQKICWMQLWKENLVKVELANFYCNCFSGLGKCNIMVLTETSLNSHWKSLLEQVRKQTYLWQWILLQDHCWWCRVPHTGAISLWSKMGQPQIQGT